jgi:hypothetical protein
MYLVISPIYYVLVLYMKEFMYFGRFVVCVFPLSYEDNLML